MFYETYKLRGIKMKEKHDCEWRFLDKFPRKFEMEYIFYCIHCSKLSIRRRNN